MNTNIMYIQRLSAFKSWKNNKHLYVNLVSISVLLKLHKWIEKNAEGFSYLRHNYST